MNHTYLLLARCEESVLSAVEENIGRHFEYEKLSAKLFWVQGDLKSSDTLNKIMSGIRLSENIVLYPLTDPYTPQDLPHSFPSHG